MLGLTLKVKYCRIVRRVIHGKDRFYVQLIQQGVPYRKPQHTIGKGKVGIDLGPSSVAIVGERKAMLLEFCPSVAKDAKKTRKLQRRTDRQRRANNPDNYNPNGTIKEGPKKWNISKYQKKVEAQLKEADRVLAAHRDSEHGALANKVLTMGDDIRHEKVSIKGWQKRYGKSIGRKAPGSFQSKVDRKAESAGGKTSEVSTYKTKLSQTCQCGHVEKKSLSERWHRCPSCGIVMQRDLYTGYLLHHVEDNILNADQAAKHWSGMETILQAALEDTYQRAIREGHALSSFGLEALSQSASSVNFRLKVSEAEAESGDAAKESLLESRTPGIYL